MKKWKYDSSYWLKFICFCSLRRKVLCFSLHQVFILTLMSSQSSVKVSDSCFCRRTDCRKRSLKPSSFLYPFVLDVFPFANSSSQNSTFTAAMAEGTMWELIKTMASTLHFWSSVGQRSIFLNTTCALMSMAGNGDRSWGWGLVDDSDIDRKRFWPEAGTALSVTDGAGTSRHWFTGESLSGAGTVLSVTGGVGTSRCWFMAGGSLSEVGMAGFTDGTGTKRDWSTAATGSWSMVPLIRESESVSELLKYSGGVLRVGLNVCLALNSINSATMLVSLPLVFFRSSMMSGKSICSSASAIWCVSNWTATFLVWTMAQPPEHSASEPEI